MRKKTATPEEVWALLKESQKTSAKETQELRELQKETDRQMKETDRQLKESKLEVDRQMKETDRQLKESKLKVDKEFKELKEFFKEQGVRLDKANGNFNNKWGAFIEKLIAGDLVSLLKEQGIPVTDIDSRKALYRGR